jgi:threonine dehydrogenase-like Zn-dependent dehydrogenase
MKILQVTAPQEYQILDVPTPKPGPGEVLLRVLGVTTCPQWDLHLRHNEPMFVGRPFSYPYTVGQPGHEATGVIEAVGEGVTSVKPGDRVSAWRDPGHQVPGCYAQFVVHKAENVIRVPEHLPVPATAPVELAMCLGTVFRMLREMNVLQGRTLGINGLGPAGLIALQMARAEGASEVFGFDPVAERREMASRLGAAGAYDPAAVSEAGSPAAAEFPLRPRARLETAVDCVGSKAAVEFMMDHTTDVVALFGVQREDYTYAVGRHGGLRLCGYKGHWRESAEYAVGLMAEGKLDLAPLVTHSLPLERYGEGIELLDARQAIKVCFLPWA